MTNTYPRREQPSTTFMGGLLLCTAFTLLGTTLASAVLAQAGQPGPVNPPPVFSKVFVPDMLNQGELSTLTFTIDNSASSVNASNLDFRDNFPNGIDVGPVGGGTSTCIGGGFLATPGENFVRYANGIVGAGEVCTVSFELLITGPGILVSQSQPLTSSLGTSNSAIANVTTPFLPMGFSKSFVPSFIGSGAVSTLIFQIENPNGGGVDDLEFRDDLPPGMLVASPNGASTTCIGGTLVATPGTSVIRYTNGATSFTGTNCRVEVDVTPSAPGTYTNVSGPLTSVAGTTRPAEAVLEVPEPLTLSREILGNPALPGALMDIRYTLSNPKSFFHILITFDDPLDDMLPGLRLEGEQTQICGPSSQLTGDSTLTLSLGFLSPGESCSFVASVRVPADASAGSYSGQTGEVNSIIGNTPVIGPNTSGVLEVTSMELQKSFPPGPAQAGSVVPLTFTLANPSGDDMATELSFSDPLDSVLPGLRAVGFPTEPCGPGSLVSGSEEIQLSGGSLAAGENCQFAVDVEIPSTAPPGTYLNVTTPLDAVVEGTSVAGAPSTIAQAPLEVEEAPVLPPVSPLEIPTLSQLFLWLLAAALGFLALRRLRA